VHRGSLRGRHIAAISNGQLKYPNTLAPAPPTHLKARIVVFIIVKWDFVLGHDAKKK